MSISKIGPEFNEKQPSKDKPIQKKEWTGRSVEPTSERNETIKDVFKEQIDKITDFANSNTYDEVSQFASDITGLPQQSLKINKVEPGLTTGASGALVYLVSDLNSDKLLLVVKITDPKKATDEEKSLDFLNKLGVEEANFPHVLKMEKIAESSDILIAQSAVSGKSLEYFMTSVGNLGGQEREEKLEEFSKIIEASAQALASLHNHKPAKYDNDSDINERNKVLKDYKTQLLYYLNKIDNSKGKNDSLKKINLLLLLSESDQVKFSPVGEYVHEDYHLGNVYYDEKSSPKISIIDNDGIMYSVGSTGMPIGIGALDVVYFMQWIAIQGHISQLNPEEIQNLQTGFLNAYIGSRENVDEHLLSELEFMKIYIPTKYICRLQAALEDKNHPWNQALGRENILGFIEVLANNLSNSYKMEF